MHPHFFIANLNNSQYFNIESRFDTIFYQIHFIFSLKPSIFPLFKRIKTIQRK